MNNTDPNTIFQAFEATFKKNPGAKVIYFKENNDFSFLSYQDLYSRALYVAHLLLENSIKKSDSVAIILENSPLWPIAFFGVMRLGAIAVPLYHELAFEELRHLMLHSETRAVLTSANIAPRVKEAVSGLSIPIIVLNSEEMLTFCHPEGGHIRFAQCGLRPTEGSIPRIDSSLRPSGFAQNDTFQQSRQKFLPIIDVSPDDIASIVYTSGTTALPKGVMLSHKNYISNLESVKQSNLITPDDCLISLLPLYHTYPFMVNLLLPILIGARISFPASLDFTEISLCMQKTPVTVLTGVPRLFTRFYERINENIKNAAPLKRVFLNVVLNISLQLRNCCGFNLSKIALGQLHSKFGADLRFMVSGGAKLNKDIASAFYKWGFTILEGYGLTETSPVVSFNTLDNFKFGSVGKPTPGVGIKVNEPGESGIGEILVKGDNVTSGYYKDKAFTAESIKGGWFFTRDLGYVDEDGFLFITGRKNETIVLSSGKKISPEELETYFSKSPYIKEICVFLGAAVNNEDFLTAVIYPNLEYCQAHGVSQIKDRIRREIEILSRGLPAYRRLRDYIIVNETLPKTVLGKVKRYEVEKKYGRKFRSAELKKVIKELSSEDKHFLSSSLCQKAFELICKKVKRPINLDDHLELDLGLDSLARIDLFFELEKLAGFEMDDKTFSEAFTVRDALNKLKAVSNIKFKKEDNINWGKILNSPFEKEITGRITITQTVLAKSANLLLYLPLRLIMRCLFLLKVKGRENIPKSGPVIFCPNHSSYLDAPLLAAAIGMPALLRVYFLGYSAYLDHFFIGWAKKLFRLISIDPSSKLADTLKACSFVLINSKALCVFPEGARSVDGGIKEFKRGVGILIKELNVSVVPVSIRGTYKAWPAHKTLPKPAKVEIIFGKKMRLQDLLSTKTAGIDIYQNIANTLRAEVIKLQK